MTGKVVARDVEKLRFRISIASIKKQLNTDFLSEHDDVLDYTGTDSTFDQTYADRLFTPVVSFETKTEGVDRSLIDPAFASSDSSDDTSCSRILPAIDRIDSIAQQCYLQEIKHLKHMLKTIHDVTPLGDFVKVPASKSIDIGMQIKRCQARHLALTSAQALLTELSKQIGRCH